MKKWYFSFLFLAFIPLFFTKQCFAQNYTERPEYIKANSNWIFSEPYPIGSGIDFNTNPPTALTGTASQGESAGVMSDTATGDLLFYSNGQKCWNKNYQVMPNGDGLFGGSSSNQAAVIVPVIDSPGKFYLFTLKSYNFGGLDSSLYYSIVDMSLDNGLGDIDTTRKNILLDVDPLQESMLAVPGNNCDVWLLVHPYHDTIFKAYHITREGLDPNPVISSPGSHIGGSVAAFESGSMAISPDRSLLSIVSYSPECMTLGLVPELGGAMITQFDPETGMVSNGIKLNDSIAPYHSCFSPDNTKLYIQGLVADSATGNWSGTEGTTEIIQYDVSTYTQAAIVGSKYTVHTFPQGTQFLSMRRWGDTIIVSGDLPYIASPNQAGAACNFQTGPYIDSVATGTNYNLGTEAIYPLPPDTIYRVALDTAVCDNLILEAPSSFTEYVWDNNDTGTTREVSTLGTYWVAYNDGCHFGVDTFIIDMANLNPVITINVFELGTTMPYDSYQWMLNGNTLSGATNSTYTVLENGDYQVIVGDENGCIDTSDIYIVTNVGIHDVHPLAKDIRIYPNPGNDVIHIEAPVQTEIMISTVEGRIIRSEKYEKPINIRTLPAGLYLIKVNDRSGSLIKTEKFIKTP